jgi:hypothetical protein
MVSVMHLPAMLDRRVLFLDVGPTMTEIDVICSNVLAFSRAANVTVPFQGGELVADDSRVSSKAELSGLALSDSVQSSSVDELLVEITRTLQAYRATEAAENIEQIVIGGGTGVERTLVEAVDERFKLPAMMFDPTVPLGVDEQEAPKLRAFASTLGLAWGLGDEGALELDFLNPKKPIPPGQSLNRRLRIGGIAAAVVLLAGASWVVAERLERTRELDGLRAETRQLKEQWEEFYDLDVKRIEAVAWDAEARAAVWLDHLLRLTQKMIEPGKKMLVADLTFNLNPANLRNAKITISLICSDWEVATEFVKNLNAVTTEDGERLYRAEQAGWQDVKTAYPEKYKGKVNVTVELLGLTERTTIDQREKDYRDMRKIK